MFSYQLLNKQKKVFLDNSNLHEKFNETCSIKTPPKIKKRENDISIVKTVFPSVSHETKL